MVYPQYYFERSVQQSCAIHYSLYVSGNCKRTGRGQKRGIVVIGRLSRKFNDIEERHFENCEKQMFIEHGFTLDYEHMENPEIQQKRRKIDESKNINSFGIWCMIHSMNHISASVIQIILSIGFSTSLFVTFFRQSGDMLGAVIFPLVIVALIVLSIFFFAAQRKKTICARR